MQEKSPVRFMEDFMGSCFAEGVAKQLVRTMGVVQPGENTV